MLDKFWPTLRIRVLRPNHYGTGPRYPIANLPEMPIRPVSFQLIGVAAIGLEVTTVRIV